MLANCIVTTLIEHGIKAPEETLQQSQSLSSNSLQQMKAATGGQPKPSRVPPLVPTFKTKSRLQAMLSNLPELQLYHQCKQDIPLDAVNRHCPKEQKLLQLNLLKDIYQCGGQCAMFAVTLFTFFSSTLTLPPSNYCGSSADESSGSNRSNMGQSVVTDGVC